MFTGDEEFLLTLKISGKHLPPLKIKRSDEEAFRDAEKKINTKINRYRTAFGDDSSIDANDLMAMIAIEALVENFSLRNKNNTKPFEDKIDSLINELDEYLKK